MRRINETNPDKGAFLCLLRELADKGCDGSLAEIAERIDVSTGTIYSWSSRKNTKYPSQKSLVALAKLYAEVLGIDEQGAYTTWFEATSLKKGEASWDHLWSDVSALGQQAMNSDIETQLKRCPDSLVIFVFKWDGTSTCQKLRSPWFLEMTKRILARRENTSSHSSPQMAGFIVGYDEDHVATREKEHLSEAFQLLQNNHELGRRLSIYIHAPVPALQFLPQDLWILRNGRHDPNAAKRDLMWWVSIGLHTQTDDSEQVHVSPASAKDARCVLKACELFDSAFQEAPPPDSWHLALGKIVRLR